MIFHKGLEINLPKGNQIIENDFYLAEDTKRLYLGGKNRLILINDNEEIYIPTEQVNKTIFVEQNLRAGRLVSAPGLADPILITRNAKHIKIKIDTIEGGKNTCLLLDNVQYADVEINKLQGKIGIILKNSSFNVIKVNECCSEKGIQILDNSFGNVIEKFNWVVPDIVSETPCGFYTGSSEPSTGPAANIFRNLTIQGGECEIASLNATKNTSLSFNYINVSENQRIFIDDQSWNNQVDVLYTKNKIEKIIEIDSGLIRYQSHKVNLPIDFFEKI